MIKRLIQRFLGIDELDGKVNAVVQQVKVLNRRVENIDQQVKDIKLALEDLGDYKNRTKTQLSRMDKRIGGLISSVNSLVELAKTKEDTKAAKDLLKQLKIHKALIGKAKEAQKAQGA